MQMREQLIHNSMLFLLHPINLPLIHRGGLCSQRLITVKYRPSKCEKSLCMCLWVSKSAKSRNDKSNNNNGTQTNCVLKDIEVVRTRTGIGCVENCYTYSWMQICVGKCTALIPRTVRLLFSTCNCERGGRSRERESQRLRRLGGFSSHASQSISDGSPSSLLWAIGEFFNKRQIGSESKSSGEKMG